MRRKPRTILFFGVCALAVLGAMGWLTVEIRTLEKREAAARREAASDAWFQEAVRRSLWRMDSFAQLFMATEAARPHLYYNSLFSPEQAYYLTQGAPSGSWAVACADDLRVPSPLLRAEPEFCRLHFQIVTDVSDGRTQLMTPRYPPSAESRAFAIDTQNVQQEDLVEAAGLMERLKALARPERLAALAHAATGTSGSFDPADVMDPIPYSPSRRTAPQQQGQIELSQRRQTANQAMNVRQSLTAPLSMDAREIEVGSLTPAWIGAEESEPELVLLRRVRIHRVSGDEEIIQGVWVDWPALRTAMLEKVEDLFPRAELMPAVQPSDEPERLATIPAVLRPGPYTSTITAGVSTSRSAMLYVAWGGVLAALVAVGVVVRALIDLGERRGRFVSAVTHELRTPLTTFCLYSEMLADGLVRDEKAKQDYMSTLKRESQRLAKIVENVLCYARLAEVRSTAKTQRIDASELIDRSLPALTRRATEAGMELVTDLEGAENRELDVDPQTVERILMNLVDNACKYAHGHVGEDQQADNRIHLTARADGGEIEFVVADHGPGIPKIHRGTVFKAFNRSRTSTQSTAPGLGLGLSLARGLARELGGELRLTNLPPGFKNGTAMSVVLPANKRVVEVEEGEDAELRPSMSAP